MGLLTGITDAIGLTDSKAGQRAADAARFNPYNINTTFGGIDYDPHTRMFTSSIDPRLSRYAGGLMGEIGGINPNQQLDLYRQLSAPYEQAQYQNLENRLFSQGRLGAGMEYQPGGSMRGLFDSFQQADLMRQTQAYDWANAQRNAILGQIAGIQGMEMGLFSPAQQMGAIGAQGQIAGGQMMLSNSQFTADMTKQIVDSIAQGITSGFTGGMGGGLFA